MNRFTGIAGEIADAIGEFATEKLLSKRGGTQISIPTKATGSVLADIIGVANAELFIKHIGSGKIILPCGPGRGVKGRKERAKVLLRGGASVMEVALALDLHERTVWNYKAEIGDDTQFELKFDKS